MPPQELTYGDWDSDTASSTNVDIQGDTFTLATSIPDGEDLHARYDATSLSLADGDAVSTWSDETGNGYDLTAGTSPTYKDSIINGNPVVRFDGVDDFLNVAWSTLSQPNHIFIVFQLQTFDTSAFENIHGSTDGSNRHNFLQSNSDNWSIYAGNAILGGSPDTNPHIGAGLFASTGVLHIDGTQVASGGVGSEGMGGLAVGSNQNGGANANVDVGEILVYPQDKTGNQSNIESYLSDKWGIML